MLATIFTRFAAEPQFIGPALRLAGDEVLRLCTFIKQNILWRAIDRCQS
ncbi:hypothetical protein [Bosea sp. ASV33]|nr:hypothetical protein [Bosea sp. ASV33]